VKIVEQKERTILIQDEQPCGGMIAELDSIGWTTIAHVGASGQIIDGSEWADFVKFINEIDAYRKEHPVKAE